MGSRISAIFGKKPSTTSSDKASQPADIGITKIIDGLWQFQGGSSSTPKLEIIFFHGLQMGDFRNAYRTTWLSRDGSVVWPKEWLGNKFPDARVLSVSYDSSARANQEQLDMYKVGENLVHDIILSNKGIGQKSPVVLVGHSLGGIVIKQFVLSAFLMLNMAGHQTQQIQIHKISTFLEHLKGVFYYSTPHHGSKLGDLANRIPFIEKGPYLDLLKTLNAKTERINEEFRKHRLNFKHIKASAIGENMPTMYKGLSMGVVVPEGSARYEVDSYYTAAETDHFTVCKPEDEISATFQRLCDFIVETTMIQMSQEDIQVVHAPANAASISAQTKPTQVAQPIRIEEEDTLEARLEKLRKM